MLYLTAIKSPVLLFFYGAEPYQSKKLIKRGSLMDKKNSRLRILLIEDCEADAFIIQKAVCSCSKNAQCLQAATLKAGEDILQKGETDLLLLDLGLPDTASPKDTYEQIKKWIDKLPIIILTNLQDHALAREMVHDGAADFLNKDIFAKALGHLESAIDFAMERHTKRRYLASEKEKAVREAKDKDAILDCFMGGYSISKK